MKPDLNTAILIIGFLAMWISNRHDLAELRREFTVLGARIDRVGDNLGEIHRTLGKHEADIENLKGVKK